jgi:soluble lytic murein transglycosylase-like protein
MKNRQTVKLSISAGTFFATCAITIFCFYLATTAINYLPMKTNYATYVRQDRDFVQEAKKITQIYNTDMSVSRIRHLLIYIDGLCNYYDIDYNMVKKIIAAESSWKSKARSHTNDRGLMQISKGVASDHNTAHHSCADPYTSITIGIRHLSLLKDEVGNFPSKILYAYHHGLSAGMKVSLARTSVDDYVTRVQSMKIEPK